MILDEVNLTLLPKAVKNFTEMENERFAHIKDGVAVTKFIHWLKTNVEKETITELSAAEKLYQFRSEQSIFSGTVLPDYCIWNTRCYCALQCNKGDGYSA